MSLTLPQLLLLRVGCGPSSCVGRGRSVKGNGRTRSDAVRLIDFHSVILRLALFQILRVFFQSIYHGDISVIKDISTEKNSSVPIGPALVFIENSIRSLIALTLSANCNEFNTIPSKEDVNSPPDIAWWPGVYQKH